MKRERCPKCHKQGRDKSGDNLIDYGTHKHCFSCGYHTSNESLSDTKKKSKSVRLPSNIDICSGIEYRGIQHRTCSKANVYEETGYDKRDNTVFYTGIVLFCFYNRDSKLVGIKRRDFFKQYEEGYDKNKCIWVEGELTLGGLEGIINSKRKEVCIWEGEVDWLTAVQLDSRRDHVFLPGTNFTELVKVNSDILRRYSKIYIGLDDDRPGNKATELIQHILPVYKLHRLEYNLFGVNDLSELYSTGGEYKELINRASTVGGDNLITGNELVEKTKEYYQNREKLNKIPTGFKVIDSMLNGGLSPTEFLAITSETGLGKSTLVANICYNLIQQEIKSVWIGTEMQYQQTLQKFIELFVKRHYTVTKDGPTISNDEVQRAVEFLSQYIVFYTKCDPNYHEELHDKILEAVYRYDIRCVFIDVLSDLQGMSDWKVCKDILKSLNSIAVGDTEDGRDPVAIVGVVHQADKVGRSTKKVAVDKMAGGTELRRKPTAIIGMEGSIDSTVRKLILLKGSRMETTDTYGGYLEFNKVTREYHDTEKTITETEESYRGRSESATVRHRDGLPVRTDSDRVHFHKAV